MSATRNTPTAVDTTGRLFAFGALSALPDATLEALRNRTEIVDPTLTEQVAAIIASVRKDGDAALRRYAAEFDGATLESLEIPQDVVRRAWDELDPVLRNALQRAARNITSVHRKWTPRLVEHEVERGVILGRRPDPLARVGVYAPGGTATYPSSVLMGAIPARVAGVGEIILCTPPNAAGTPSQVVLAAAALAGVDRVFALGGAGAVAAMAYGTDSVPDVDCIVGPGNAWVAEAKRQVSKRLRIDTPAGPSELLVIAEPESDVDAVARELLAQAEHDPRAIAIAIIVGPRERAEPTATRLAGVLLDLAARTPRTDIATSALRAQGAITWCETEADALAFTAAFAPEHVLLAMRNAEQLLPGVRHAGTVFVGNDISATYGDYITGANHTLPTGGRARQESGLSTEDFVRWTTWQQMTPAAAQQLADDAACLAEAEGLFAHAEAARGKARP